MQPRSETTFEKTFEDRPEEILAPSGDSFGLAQLIAPFTVEEFLSIYWEKQICHIHGRTPAYYASLFSLRDVDAALLPVRSKTDTGVPLVSAIDKKRPPEDLGSLYQNFASGSTINVNFIDRQFPDVNFLCRRLEQEFHFPSAANLYLTPPHSQGFRAHYDSHEVFVLQISGRKKWDLWPQKDLLPLRDSKEDVAQEELGEARSIVLEPGDLLYLPRGVIHQAYAEDQVTLHITVSVEPFRWFEVVMAALKAAAGRTPALRESLPPGFMNIPDIIHPAREQLRTMLSLIREDDLVTGLTETAKAFTSQLTPVLDNRFETLGSLNSLSGQSLLSRRIGSVAFLETRGNSIYLHFGGNTVSAPARIRPSLEFILARDRFSVETIPGLDAASRLVLVRRLVRAGFLTVSS
jgi:mannose-6-phosphate isomerase-like protein (cupin superfamily)